jgi:hypothetical protein
MNDDFPKVIINRKDNNITVFSHNCNFYKKKKTSNCNKEEYCKECKSFRPFFIDDDDVIKDILKDKNIALLNIRNYSEFKRIISLAVLKDNIIYE